MNVPQLLFNELKTASVPFHIKEISTTTRYVSRPHFHDFHEFFLVTAGNVLHTLNGHKHDVPAGTLVHIRPADIHCMGMVGTLNARYVNFAFTTTELERTERYLGITGTDRHYGSTGLSGRTAEDLRAAAGRMRAPGLTERDMTVAGRVLLSMMVGAAADNGQRTGVRLPAWLDAACRAMDEPGHYRSGVQEFVRLAGCTQEHLTRSLRKYLGTTPTAFVNKRKIRDSALLLETTDRQVLEIAYEAGFNNLSHFNTVFNKELGTSPGRYRRERGRVINA